MASRKKPADAPKIDAEEAVDTAAQQPGTEEHVAEDAIEDAEVIEEIAAEAAPEPEPEPEADPEEVAEDPLIEPNPEPVHAADPAPAAAPVVIRKGGFLPMLLGGVAAAAIGFGAARYVLPEGWPWPGAKDDEFQTLITGQIDRQASALAALKAQVAKGPDLSGIEANLGGLTTEVGALGGRIDGAIERVSGRIDMIETRLSDLEKRPITEGASPAAVAAYERELKALQQAMAAQRAEIEGIAEQAARKEANAEITAQEALKRAALSRILTALDSGAGFADAAASLGEVGVTLPPALAGVASEGVDTMAALGDAFPVAARAALAVARKGKGDGGGFSAFLKTQLGARSLEPKEGDDADAVLSRAEAAVREGRLTDAMAELDALPEAARAEMAGWLARAGARAEALAAVEALAAQVNSN